MNYRGIEYELEKTPAGLWLGTIDGQRATWAYATRLDAEQAIKKAINKFLAEQKP